MPSATPPRSPILGSVPSAAVPARPAAAAGAVGAAGSAPADELGRSPHRTWQRILTAMLLFMIFYIPNLAQIPLQTGLRGLNPLNVLFLGCLFAIAQVQHPRSQPAPLRGPLWLLSLLLAWALIVGLAGDSSAWVEDVTIFKNAIFYPLLMVLFYYAVQDRPTVRLMLAMVLFVTFTSAVLGLRQALDYGIGAFNETRRVAAPFSWEMYDANRSAVFFAIFLQLAAAAALFLKSRPWIRLACGMLYVLGVFVVFHTYSRQVYFILALLLVVISLRKHLLICLVASVVLLNYEAWVPQSVVDRIMSTSIENVETARKRPEQPNFDDPVSFGTIYSTVPVNAEPAPWHGSQAATAGPELVAELQLDQSTESRLLLWAGAWEMIQEHPLGVGLNRFKRMIGGYAHPSVAGKDAHNFYVLITAEAGLLAPVVVLVLLGSLLWLGWRLHSFRNDEETRVLSIGFVLATLAVMLGNVYGSRFLDGDVMGNYWVLAGLVARMLVIKRGEQSALEARQRQEADAQRAAQQAAWQTSREAQAARTRQRAGYSAPSTRDPRAPVTAGRFPGSR